MDRKESELMFAVVPGFFVMLIINKYLTNMSQPIQTSFSVYHLENYIPSVTSWTVYSPHTQMGQFCAVNLYNEIQ